LSKTKKHDAVCAPAGDPSATVEVTAFVLTRLEIAMPSKLSDRADDPSATLDGLVKAATTDLWVQLFQDRYRCPQVFLNDCCCTVGEDGCYHCTHWQHDPRRGSAARGPSRTRVSSSLSTLAPPVLLEGAGMDFHQRDAAATRAYSRSATFMGISEMVVW